MFYIPTEGVNSWRELLADPDKHWKSGRSAYCLAHSWEDGKGFPTEVKDMFNGSGISSLRGVQFLFGFPEYQVALPGGSQSSQTDLYVLAKSNDNKTWVIMVEGKVDEEFGPLVSAWRDPANCSQGKKERLTYILGKIGLPLSKADNIRYQLLHRTASAVIEAERVGAPQAMVLVHSFCPNGSSFDDYKAFLSLYGLSAKVNGVSGPVNLNGISLYFAWVKGCP